MQIKAEQQRLYEALPEGCFLRVCKNDRALWISDWPRREQNPSETLDRLGKMGFNAWLEGGLCLLDWTQERWQEQLLPLEQKLPPFPAQERLHEAYALCRFWLLHPQAFSADMLPVLRRVVKLTQGPEELLLRAVRLLHAQAAEDWRQKGFCAHAAGLVLAAWLRERSV